MSGAAQIALGVTGYSRYEHSFVTGAAGLMADVMSDVFALYGSAKSGDRDKEKQESLKLIKRNIPGQNFLYPEPALANL